MTEQRPKVSVGMPLYNGADTLHIMLDSVLAQTFTDFELIISDNCSTDASAEVVGRYADKDPRVRYHCAPINRGSPLNFSNAAQLARGEYFVWAMDDDLFEPTYFERCFEALDADPSLVLVYATTNVIDDQGAFCRVEHDQFDLTSDDPKHRYATLVQRLGWCNCLSGMIRHEQMMKTRLLANDSIGADNLFLAELVLRGKFLQLDEALFHRRIGERKQNFAEKLHRLEHLYGGEVSFPGLLLPYNRLGKRHLEMLLRAEVSEADRKAMFQWTRAQWRPRWAPQMEIELDRAVQMVRQRRYYENWAQPYNGQTGLMLDGLRAFRVLEQLDDALMFWPAFPGLHLARSICFQLLGRPAEAAFERALESKNHPELVAGEAAATSKPATLGSSIR
jgi:glycosyltransferase involved in cell wall biosynthesis